MAAYIEAVTKGDEVRVKRLVAVAAVLAICGATTPVSASFLDGTFRCQPDLDTVSAFTDTWQSSAVPTNEPLFVRFITSPDRMHYSLQAKYTANGMYVECVIPSSRDNSIKSLPEFSDTVTCDWGFGRINLNMDNLIFTASTTEYGSLETENALGRCTKVD